MADSTASCLAHEANDPGSSEAVRGSLRDTEEQEGTKGEAATATSEPVREELVQSAVSFLKHPKVVASSDVQRRSFLENKGLTVDEIEEAFRRLLSPSSNCTSSNTCKSQGMLGESLYCCMFNAALNGFIEICLIALPCVSLYLSGVPDLSCGITQEAKISTGCVDDSGTLDSETVTPVVPRHPKSYIEVMEMIQRGERPDDIQDINDEPPNPDQPISEPRMAPKPKPWEKQVQESPGLDLKAHPSGSSEPTSGVQTDSTNQGMESNNNSGHGDAPLMAKPAMGSEAPTDDDAASPEQ
ncbi:hypothetical protein ACQ4PT_067377 [Festuca glaucescens]